LNNLKLNLDHFPKNYHTIAIRSDLSEFRLAFFLNKELKICLKRKNQDIYLSDNNARYSIFEYLDEVMYLKWIFFSNKALVVEKKDNLSLNLFSQQNSLQNKIYLINQPKGVDYFMIIENVKNNTYVQKVLRKISEISGVITTFVSDKELENKENLIFS
tara:strand:- start:2028 stop:2504 length:477 start_codon:yes stop_codon:yes gene_type:complete